MRKISHPRSVLSASSDVIAAFLEKHLFEAYSRAWGDELLYLRDDEDSDAPPPSRLIAKFEESNRQRALEAKNQEKAKGPDARTTPDQSGGGGGQGQETGTTPGANGTTPARGLNIAQLGHHPESLRVGL